MSLVCIFGEFYAHGFPRASGDEPLAESLAPAIVPFSPRERG